MLLKCPFCHEDLEYINSEFKDYRTPLSSNDGSDTIRKFRCKNCFTMFTETTQYSRGRTVGYIFKML